MLREVKMEVELPALKKKAIQELGYGANAKVLVGFKSRPWEKLGYTGATYSDETFQLAWDNSFLQPAPAGGSTLYSGGKLALEAGKGTAEEVAVRLLRGIETRLSGHDGASATARSRASTGRRSRGPRRRTPATSRGSGRRSPAPKGCRSATCSSPASTAATISRAT